MNIMNIGKHKTISNIWLAIFLLSLVWIKNAYCQEPSSVNDSIAAVTSTFAISEIPGEFTALSNHLVEISKIIQSDKKILNNDVVIREYSILLEERKKEIIKTLPSMTYQRLESHIRAWHNLNNRFDIIQETLEKRINEIESVKNELNQEAKRWEHMSVVQEEGEFPRSLSILLTRLY